jgi:hypothetical protein
MISYHYLIEPEFAVYRHLWTPTPCVCKAELWNKLEIHRYMRSEIILDNCWAASHMRRHVLTNDPTAPHTRSRRHLLPARRPLLP